MELGEETHAEGGENRFAHRLPGRASYPDLVLKRGLVDDSAVTQWCSRAIRDFVFEPVTVWVSLMDEEHEPLRTYTVQNAYPRKWSISDLNAEASEIVIESLELAYQMFNETEV
jgi:phage tail-like protein